jgi:hypothetical protein
MSRRYSTSRQVFYSITGVTVSQAAVIGRHLAPSFGTPSLLCIPIERNLKGLDWEKGSYRMASQVPRFDPFRFRSMGSRDPNSGGLSTSLRFIIAIN